MVKTLIKDPDYYVWVGNDKRKPWILQSKFGLKGKFRTKKEAQENIPMIEVKNP